MPAQNSFRLDDEQGVFPGLQPAGEQDEKPALRLREARTLDRAVEDDELLAQEEVLGDQLWFTARKVRDGAQRKGGGAGPGPA